MGLTTTQAAFTRYADGSLRIVSSGGVDPLLTGDEGAALGAYITATDAAMADAVAAVEADVAADEVAVSQASHDASLAAALSSTEVVPAP